MRTIERIDNFLEKVDWEWLLDNYWGTIHSCHSGIALATNSEWLSNKWKENPDLRIGQLLINLGFIDDNMKVWMVEESDILAAQGLPPEEYLYWTANYDKDENLLETPITKLVKDLDSDHILNIFSFFHKFNRVLPNNYVTAFNNVLRSRGIENNVINNE